MEDFNLEFCKTWERLLTSHCSCVAPYSFAARINPRRQPLVNGQRAARRWSTSPPVASQAACSAARKAARTMRLPAGSGRKVCAGVSEQPRTEARALMRSIETTGLNLRLFTVQGVSEFAPVESVGFASAL